MKNKDKLGIYLKEIPLERPSDNFTNLVMDRVRLEPKKSPVLYHPIISGQIWWRVFICIALVSIGTLLLRSYFPGNDSPAFLQSFYQIDFSFVTKPFQLLSNMLNKLPIAVVTGVMAASFLLVIDQIYSRFVVR
jgi:hypothetical protein